MKILIVATFLFALNSCSADTTTKVEEWQECNYDYPAKPGTPEWKELWDKLESYEAMVSVLQIPDSILQCISTNNLLTLCLQYPFLLNVFAFNGTLTGLEDLFVRFNGIREFSKRENAINYLQEKYLSEVQSFPNKLDSDTIMWHSKMQISILELLLSYSEFHYNTSKEDRKKILENLWFGYNEKIKYAEYFAGRDFETNLFARAHLVIKIEPSLLEIFENTSILFSGMTTDADLINKLDSLTFELIK